MSAQIRTMNSSKSREVQFLRGIGIKWSFRLATNIKTDLWRCLLYTSAGRFQILFRVVAPLIKPGMLAVGIYAFLLSWDDYLHASTLIQTDSLRTLSAGVALRYLGELSYDWSLINTISIVGTLPMVLLFFFFQKYMVKGLVAGAVKGLSLIHI